MSKCLVLPPPPFFYINIFSTSRWQELSNSYFVEKWIMQLNDFEDNDNKIYIMDYNYVNE